MTPDDLAPLPPSGRVVRRTRPVRVSDTTPTGRLRLDAVARFLQDVSADDTAEVELEDKEHWVVRRLAIEAEAFPVLREQLELATWCGAIGSHYAERRVSIRGDRGGHVEAAALWVHIDVATGRPKRLPDAFAGLYGEAAQGRRASARLTLHDPSPEVVAGARPWPLRHTDFDVLGHVNNAVYWSPVEEAMAPLGHLRGGVRAVMEHRGALEPGADARTASVVGEGTLSLWVLDGSTGAVAASARVDHGPG